MGKILLVEDNEDNSDMLIRRLARKGYEVSLAQDGEQALAMAPTLHPGLILMDMRIPLIDGWTVTMRLKSSPDTHEIPIIGLSAHALTEDRDKALAAGCDEYETKPIDFLSLLAKINGLIVE
jgi:two-component system response regulator